MRYSSLKSILATPLKSGLCKVRTCGALGVILFTSSLANAATYDVSGLPVKSLGDALTATELNLMVDMLRNIKKDDRGDADVTNDRVGIGIAGSPSQMLDVNGNVNATGFIGDGSLLTNLPNPGLWTQTATDIYYNTGKVGIGINTSPTEELEVHSTSNSTILAKSTAANSTAQFVVENDSQRYALGVDGSKGDVFEIYNTTSGDSSFSINPTTNNITTSDNLTVNGDVTSTGVIYATEYYDTDTGTPIGGGLWKAGTGEADEIYYDTANVGIGAGSDPAYVLDVTGDSRFSSHVGFGATGLPSVSSVVKIDENTTDDASRYLLNVQGTASGNTTGSFAFNGIYTDAEHARVETAGNATTRGIYSRARSSGVSTFYGIKGIEGVAYNDSSAGAGLGSVYGVRGEAYNNDTIAAVASIYGGNFIGRGKSSLPAGPITSLYGTYNQAVAYEAAITNAYGAYNYARTINGDTGDIGTAYGSYNRVYVDSDDGGDITTGHAGYFYTGRRAGATLMTTATGVYSDANDGVTNYAGRFYADDTDGTTNYGIITTASGGTHNYALWTGDGDWVLDEDGDGSLGGAVGGDLLIGEGADLRIYHNGTDSVIDNRTGDLVLTNSGSGFVGIGTSTPTRRLTVGGGDVQLDNNAKIYFKRSSGTADPFIEYNSSNAFRIFNPTDNPIIFGVNSGEMAQFNSAGLIFNGNHTVGTLGSANTLAVSGNSGLSLRSSDGGGSGNISFLQVGVEVATVDTTGDMGIGDTTPDATLKLDVEGQVGATHYCDANGANCTLAADLGASEWDVVGGGINYAGGNVGIGTSSPSGLLEVQGNNGAHVVIDAEDTGGSPATVASLTFDGYDGRAKGLFFTDDANSDEWFIGEGYNYSGVGIGRTTLPVSQSEYAVNALFFVGTNGQVGIGTTAPSEELHVRTDQANPTTVAVQNTSTSTNTNTRAGFSASANGGQLDVMHYGSAAAGSLGDQIKADAAFIRTSSSAPASKLVIGNGGAAPINFITGDQQRMVIEAGGDIGIGVTNPVEKFEVAGSVANLRLTDTDTGADTYLLTNSAVGGAVLAADQNNEVAGSYLALNVDGSEGVRIIANGNVGIGTPAPQTPLDVSGTASVGGSDNISPTAGGAGQLQIKGSGYTGFVALDGTAMNIGHNSGSRLLNLLVNETTRVSINSTGNVGIGTTSPDSKLHISGNSSAKFILEDAVNPRQNYVGITGSDNLVIAADEDNLGSTSSIQFRVDASEKARITDTGRLGIGTTTPGSMLTVNSGTTNVAATFANSDGTAKIRVSDTGGSAYISTSSGKAYFGASSTDSNNLTVTSAGGVGIGDATPDGTLKLDVEGKIGATEYCDEAGANCTLASALGSGYWTKSGDDVYYAPGATGEVGIGISNPTEELVVNRSANNAPTTVAVQNSNTGTGTNTRAGFAVQSNGAALDLMAYSSGATGTIGGQNKADNAFLRTSSSSSPASLNLGTGGAVPLNLFTTDIQRMVVEAGGDVGIGTTNPTSLLEVLGDVEVGRGGLAGQYNSAQVQGVWTIGDGYRISEGSNDFGTQYGMVYAHTNAGTTGTKKPIAGWGHQILFTNAGVRNAAISLSSGHGYFGGNVGIGTTTPGEDLHISGTAANIALTDTDTGADAAIASNSGVGGLALQADINSEVVGSYVDLSVDGATRLRVQENGNVGIGTTSPQEKLEVEGSIVATPVLYASNQDQPYLIAGSTSYTGATTNWGTEGFQHRIKTNSGGTPRITIEAPTGGETFTMENGGEVGIGGVTAPTRSLHVAGSGMRIDNASTTYDLWLQGGAASSGDDRNLAFLGTDEDSGDFLTINYAGEYAAGVRIPSNVGVGANFALTQEFHVRKDQAAATTALVQNVSAGAGSDVRAANVLASNGAQMDMSVYGTAATGTLGGVAKADGAFLRTTSGAPVANMVIGNGAAVPLTFITSDAARMTIEGGGDIGIGDTTPDGTLKLDVEGPIGATAYCDEDGANCVLQGDLGSGKWLDGVGANEIYYSAANVGIGTTNPEKALNVIGNIQVGLAADAYHSDLGSNTLAFNRPGFSYIDNENATGSLAFRTGGTSNVDMFIRSDGNVGIGITGPSEELHVYKSQAAPTTVAVQNTSTNTNTNTRAGFSASANGGQLDLMHYGSAAAGSLGGTTKADAAYVRTSNGNPASKLVIGNGGATPVHFITNDTTRMLIEGGGNVGIGTTNPDSIFHIVSEEIGTGSNKGFRISNHDESKEFSIRTGITGLNNTSLVVYDETSAQNRLVVESGGNVGIGLTDATQKLDVNGNTMVRGRMAITDIGTLASNVTLDMDRTSTSGAAQYGIRNDLTYNGTITANRTHYAVYNRVNNTGSNGAFQNNFIGTRAEVENSGSSVLQTGYGLYAHIDQNSTGALISGRALYGLVDTAASTTITTGYGLMVDLSNNGTITTNYGIYINDVVEGTQTNAYALWANEGDFILDGDGNGVRGGTHAGSDLFFGEGQDAAIWYDGADLQINPDKVGTGNVVIGGQLEAPELMFERNNNGVADKTSWVGGSGTIQGFADAAIDFYEADAMTRRFRFDLNNNRLGIGLNNTPSEALDVTGNIEFSGNLQRASGQFKCPVGELMVGFDDGTDGNNGLICELPSVFYN